MKKSFGQRCIESLRDFIRRADAGEPIEQVVRRRMKVKGKTVYTREKFCALLKGKP